jgi:hypothetical protein
VTARDEAIRAVWRAMDYLPRHEATAAIDAIPNDVLVRLAIERGALRPTSIGTFGEVFDTETTDPVDTYFTRLYRMVES